MSLSHQIQSQCESCGIGSAFLTGAGLNSFADESCGANQTETEN